MRHSCRLFHRPWIIGVVVSVTLTWPVSVRASQELRKEMGLLAEDVIRVVNKQPVTVGQFTPTGLQDSNAGAGIEKMLIDELNQKQKGIVQANAKFEIKGDYAFVPDRASGARHKVVKIRARIIDVETSEELKDIPVRVRVLDDTRSIAEVVQATTSLPVNATKEERIEKIDQARKSKSVFLDKGKVMAKPGSKYQVEIVARMGKDDKPIPVPAREGEGKDTGMAFVDIPRGGMYEVLVTNNHPFEAAVTLSIDGHDAFTFSEDRDQQTGRPAFSYYIVPARTTVAIRGWHKTNDPRRPDNVMSFMVMAYGEGASKRKPSDRNKVGVLTCTFAAAWTDPKGKDRPPDEPPSRSVGGNETGFGPPVKEELKPVQRQIGVIREIVNIRYTR